MKRRVKTKLYSQGGETISEVLIALLISALALTMLATMISSTVSMVTKSKTSIKEYYENSVPLEQQRSGTTGTVTIQAGSGGRILETENINLYVNSFFNADDKKVYTYSKAD